MNNIAQTLVQLADQKDKYHFRLDGYNILILNGGNEIHLSFAHTEESQYWYTIPISNFESAVVTDNVIYVKDSKGRSMKIEVFTITPFSFTAPITNK